MAVICRRGDPHHPADRLDLIRVPVIVDESDGHLPRRSSSAWTKYADAFRKISLVRFSLRFSRSNSFRDGGPIATGRRPRTRRARRRAQPLDMDAPGSRRCANGARTTGRGHAPAGCACWLGEGAQCSRPRGPNTDVLVIREAGKDQLPLRHLSFRCHAGRTTTLGEVDQICEHHRREDRLAAAMAALVTLWTLLDGRWAASASLPMRRSNRRRSSRVLGSSGCS